MTGIDPPDRTASYRADGSSELLASLRRESLRADRLAASDRLSAGGGASDPRLSSGTASVFLAHSLQKFSRPVIGLRNLGNTCYLNCIVQSLLSVPPFIAYFHDQFVESDVNAGSDKAHGRLARDVKAFVEEAFR